MEAIAYSRVLLVQVIAQPALAECPDPGEVSGRVKADEETKG